MYADLKRLLQRTREICLSSEDCKHCPFCDNEHILSSSCIFNDLPIDWIEEDCD